MLINTCIQQTLTNAIYYRSWGYLLRFLDEVQLQSIDNKMSVQNLATVFGPNILRPRVEDPVTMMEGWRLFSIRYTNQAYNYDH